MYVNKKGGIVMPKNDKYFQIRFKNCAARDDVWRVIVEYLARYIKSLPVAVAYITIAR